jgi:hypothetical protein
MREAFEAVALLWTVIIIGCGTITLALIVGRWTLKQIGREVLEHHGSVPHPAQDRP